MKPIKVICPICGEKMIVRSYGISRDVSRYLDGEIRVIGASKNHVEYTCSCGNSMNYIGTKDCWRKCKKEHKCKNCVKFQKHYPYYEVEDDDSS